MEVKALKVTMIGRTMFHGQEAAGLTGGVWIPENDDAQDLIEFAGRACYQSWNRPNQQTATNDGYLAHIIRVGHLSVLEHGSMTFYIEGVSRSLTHELVRHRHFSFSQLSQRFVTPDVADPDDEGPVLPPLFNDDSGDAQPWLWKVWDTCLDAYAQLLNIAERMDSTNRKQAREAARAVLPNMMPTAIVVTGNHRTWREFLAKRGTIHADAEIRTLALELLRQLQTWEPHVYQDMAITKTTDGVEVISSEDAGSASIVAITHAHGQHDSHRHTMEEYANHRVMYADDEVILSVHTEEAE